MTVICPNGWKGCSLKDLWRNVPQNFFMWNKSYRSWRDGSVKYFVDLGRGPGFKSQHLYDGSQLSVTPDPGDPTSSSGLYRHYIHVVHITHIHIHKNKIFFKIMRIDLQFINWRKNKQYAYSSNGILLFFLKGKTTDKFNRFNRNEFQKYNAKGRNILLFSLYKYI